MTTSPGTGISDDDIDRWIRHTNQDLLDQLAAITDTEADLQRIRATVTARMQETKTGLEPA